MINVFISHNYKDKPIARKIAKELNKYGIKSWIDESEIKLGDSLIEKIRDGLDRVDFLIALISEDSIRSEWVKRELDIAMNNEIEGRRIITVPVLAGKCDLPGFLKGKLYADMSTTRKYNENISALIKRFDISEIKDDANEFTEYKLNAVQVIEKIENTENENELIEFLESFRYSERNLFYRDTFVQTLNKLFADTRISIDALTSLIDICRYCPNDAIVKLGLTQLLEKKESQVIESTIKVLEKTKSLKIQQKKILKILKSCKEQDLEKSIWNYFLNTQLDIDIARELWEFIQEQPREKRDSKIIMCMCKLYNRLGIDEIFEEWYILWNKSNEEERLNLVSILCEYGFQSEGVFIVSPKLRNDIRRVLFDSFGENDIHNANLMIALLTGAGNLVEGSRQIWNKLIQLDAYSILLTLETLRDEYNIAYIFNSIDDVDALKTFTDSTNKEIKQTALEVIAEINLKESLEIINNSKDFLLQHYNATSLLYTIVKETNVEEYRELFSIVKEKILDGYYNKIEKNLIIIGDYLLGNTNLDALINGIDIKLERNQIRMDDTMRKVKLTIEKLYVLIEACNANQKKKIRELIRDGEALYNNF
ncbi:MAG: toll/interleukin-1 receptor domain-containing protein [Lacrimispora sp.]|uniref:toll/interleukin-1 receptor domain-containing protein n=1 Tax=Lacrimispora sp. TaxID=2719234 RepID=UPI0039E5FBE2